MKKRRKVLAALISLLALAASMRIVYVSGFLTHKHSVRNTHVFIKKNTPSSCHGIKVSASDGHEGWFHPDVDRNVTFYVGDPRIERWHKRAIIAISVKSHTRNTTETSGEADLALGESFTFEGVGTITLLDVGIYWLEFILGRDKAGDTATYCFEPAPGFNVGDDYKSHYQKQHIRTHPHPGLRPLPNKQKQRPSQPTDKSQLTSQTQANLRNKPRAEPITSPPLRIPVSPPTQRKQNR